ncbi:hypothetical protein UlMin_038180, partial [Ulmus minor]
MMGMRYPFTVSQWQELEHQALIFKYMVAGLPVPPDLVLPIQKSFDSISHRFFHHPAIGYCSFYGKKVDPEPGRCRRTDGKKWRCSKDAYPDSKYCERHMHRGRNRSRKPVESQTITQSSSTVTSLSVTGANSALSVAGTFQNLPLNAFGNTTAAAVSGTTIQSHYHIDSIPYGIPNKDFRYVQGLKAAAEVGVGVGEHSLIGDASGSNRSSNLHMNLDSTTTLDNAWGLMSSSRLNEYPPQHSFFNACTSPTELEHQSCVKQEVQGHHQSLRPFFDEWPKSRDSWSGLEEDPSRSNHTAFSTTTQLSISIPINSCSDFSPTSSRSPG